MLKRRRPWFAEGVEWMLLSHRVSEHAGLHRMTLVLMWGLMWLHLHSGLFECEWWMLQLLPSHHLWHCELFVAERGDGLLGPWVWWDGPLFLWWRGCRCRCLWRWRWRCQ